MMLMMWMLTEAKSRSEPAEPTQSGAVPARARAANFNADASVPAGPEAG